MCFENTLFRKEILMNNVITILVDSVFSKCLGNQRTTISSTPFIDQLIKKGSFYPNVYSFGPYTDAATKGLYCVEPTLDNYGYYFGINSSDNNHFREFKEQGYETYGFYYPYYLVSSKVEQYIDHSVYTSGFLFQSVWFGKLEYYSKLQKERVLSEKEYALIIKCVDMVFDCWSLFYSNLQSSESAQIVKRLHNSKADNTGVSGLKIEIEKFQNNPRKYVDELLKQGMDHALAKINEYDFSKHINQEFLKDKVFGDHRDFFEALRKVSLANAITDPEISILRAFNELKSTITTHNKNHLRYFINYGMYLLSYSYFKKQSATPNWQLMASMNKQIETLCSLLSKRNNETPFYASLHVLEPHHNVSFFSYDSDDSETVSEEIEYLYPLLKNGASKKCGNILYQLSLRYVDLCVKRLFKRLKELGLLENTTIMLVADHGSSYTFKNIRSTVTNNFHTENYNVPLVIWQSKIEKPFKGIHQGLYTSADVFPLLWNTIGLNVDHSKYPYSIFDPNRPRKYVVTEYMGPGCPDMMTREVWLSGRNNEYVVGYKINITGGIDVDRPNVVYHIKNDNQEKVNLAGKIILSQNRDLYRVIEAITERFSQIQSNSKDIVNNLDEFYVVKKENG